jgi:hypothetical protein
MTTKADLSKTDRAALELALEQMQAEGPEPAEQLEWKEAHFGWFDAATLAVYHCQRKALNLKPWESPPCWIDDPDEVMAKPMNHRGEHQAAKLLRTMLDFGISSYHPDPVAAIEAARARR